MTKHKGIYFVDGSAITGDLYHSAYAIFKNKRIIKQIVIPKKFNVYEIESMAMMDCILLAKEDGIIHCDNQQIVRELNNKQEPKDIEFYLKAIHLIKSKNLKIVWIKRDKNLAGIYLEKRLAKIKGKYLNKGKYDDGKDLKMLNRLDPKNKVKGGKN